MSETLTQAQVARVVRGAIKAHRDSGLPVGSARIAPHGFRRAAATQRFKSGLSWAQIGRELGWGESEAETMGAVYVPDEAIG